MPANNFMVSTKRGVYFCVAGLDNLITRIQDSGDTIEIINAQTKKGMRALGSWELKEDNLKKFLDKIK